MLSDYLDEDLRRFVDTYVVSFLSWDIIVFFHKNPGTDCNAATLAQKLGRQEEEVKREADTLAEKGLLQVNRNVYTCATDAAVREMAGKFYEALCEREKRLLILTAVLQKR